jgi:hypothetical protein
VSDDAEGLREQVHEALKHWHDAGQGQSPLARLVLYQEWRRNTASAQQATNKLLYQALEQLEQTQPEEAELLRRRFLDDETVPMVANRLNIAEGTVYKRQQRALEALTAVIATMEQQAETGQRLALEERLPPASYRELVGVELLLARLRPLLVAAPPWVVSLEGIGGIGKTSLADALLRQNGWRDAFEEVAWVSAKTRILKLDGTVRAAAQPVLSVPVLAESLAAQLLGKVVPADPAQVLAALQQRLKERPHLVVIDNLETFEDVEVLLPTLQRLAEPSKFLLTSRESLRGEGVYCFPVPALGEDDVVRLVRQEAESRNLEHLLGASDDELRPIYHTVGGNPLAVRLVVGQTYVYELRRVLADLVAARGASVENLYDYIYRQAWEALDEMARQVFLVMPLTPEGGCDLDFLEEVSEVAPHDLRQALEVLVRRNLVDVRRPQGELRYAIHSLTRSFLVEQVVRWQAM